MHPAPAASEDLISASEIEQMKQLAREQSWGLALVLVGFLHLLAFSVCDYLSVVVAYHNSAGYLAVWVTELLLMGLIFRLCAGPRWVLALSPPLVRFLVRLWVAYLVLAFNLGTLNTLRGHKMFELFPAMASLASFAFLVMGFALNWRFIGAALVMCVSGMLMAMYLLHSYIIFALAWWFVLNTIGVRLWWDRLPKSTGKHGECAQ